MTHILWLITGMFLGYLLWGNRPAESDGKGGRDDN